VIYISNIDTSSSNNNIKRSVIEIQNYNNNVKSQENHLIIVIVRATNE